MLVISRVLTHTDCIKMIEKVGLQKQYQKAKSYIIGGMSEKVNLQKRQPYASEIWYFRINQQYRAFATLSDGILEVFEINDHSR